METYVIIKTGLVLHLAGITLMVGITIANMAAHQQLWKLLIGEKEKALMTLRATARYPMLQMTGAILIILGGIVMMIGYHGVIMQSLWFKIKLVLIALIILNQLFIGMPMAKKLRKIFFVYQTENVTDLSGIASIKKRLLTFNRLQLVFFLLIFILSSFRFS